MLEGNLIGQREDAARGNGDELGVSAVARFADHGAGLAKLFVLFHAPAAHAARNHVVQANALADAQVFYIPADCFDDTCDFVSERQGQWMDARDSRPIMRVRMTNPGRLDPYNTSSSPVCGSGISCNSRGRPG